MGTVRLNSLPGCRVNSVADLKQGRGAFEEKQCCFDVVSIRAVKWHDNRSVVLASTFAKAHPLSTIQRWDRAKNKQSKLTILI